MISVDRSIGGILLGILPLLAFFIEYVLSEKAHEKVQIYLIGIWSKLDDIQLSEIGITEARFCQTVFDRVFGASFFSIRRYYASLFVCCAFVTIFYLSMQVVRILHGFPIRLPFSRSVKYTNIFVATISGMVSLSITRHFIAASLRLSGKFGNSIIFFLLFMGLSSWASELFFTVTVPVLNVAGPPLETIFYDLANLLLGRPFLPLFNYPDGSSVPFHVIFQTFKNEEAELLDREISGGYFSFVTASLHFSDIKRFSEIGAFSADPIVVQGMYTYFTQFCFSYLRIIFSVGLIVAWGSLWLYRSLTALLAVFLELKRGALTIMVVGIEALVSAISQIRIH